MTKKIEENETEKISKVSSNKKGGIKKKIS